MSELAVLLHDHLDFGPFGLQNWSQSEMKRLLRWFKHLGFERALFLAWPYHADEADGFNLLELCGLYVSGIRPRAGFRPGNWYDPSDRYLGAEAGLARAHRMKALMRYARDIGLEPWVQVNATHGSPQFCEEHPELLAVDAFEFTSEGMTLCPSKPAAMEHLLARNAELFKFLDDTAGVYLSFRDGGGCCCTQCTSQSQALNLLATEFFNLIRRIHPKVPVIFLSHHVHVSEVRDIANTLPEGMWVAEVMRTQSIDVPREQEIERIKLWQAAERRVEGGIAVQENQSALLPSIFPNRIDRAIALSHEMKLQGMCVGSPLNPYVFPMHWWLVTKLWRREGAVDDLVRRYFAESFGSASVEPGMRWARAMEGALDLAQAQSQRDAGFQKMLVINFAARMLPEKCMQNGVPEQFRRDMNDAVRLAREALAAGEDFCEVMREYHALDANSIIAGTEVFTHYLEMRQAKIPVLDALHDGDAPRAVTAFAKVEQACREMVDCCRNSPNTDMLARHWRRLEVLPEKLGSLKRLLPELAEKKRFRSVLMPLEMADQSWAKKSNL